jgi:hypothetical protein
MFISNSGSCICFYIYVVYKLWFCTSYNFYKNIVQIITCTTQKYKLWLVQYWPVQVITCTKLRQKSVSTCTTF